MNENYIQHRLHTNNNSKNMEVFMKDGYVARFYIGLHQYDAIKFSRHYLNHITGITIRHHSDRINPFVMIPKYHVSKFKNTVKRYSYDGVCKDIKLSDLDCIDYILK